MLLLQDVGNKTSLQPGVGNKSLVQLGVGNKSLVQLGVGNKSHVQTLVENEVKYFLTVWSLGLGWKTIDITKKSIQNREKSFIGKITNILLSGKWTPVFVKRLILQGINRYHLDTNKTFSPIVVQSMIYAVESLSLLLVSATQLDRKGYSVHIVPVVLNTLLSLYITLGKYEELLQKYFLLCPLEKNHLSSSSNTEQQGRYKVSNRYPKQYVTEAVALNDTVKGGLDNILKCYKDQLIMYDFHQNKHYSEIIKQRLSL